jgi:CxxC-x17-CxxC domain-containing protein
MFKKTYGPKKLFEKKPYDNTVHTATCSGCGKECQVPFKPNGKKPVFCSACFVREEKTGSQYQSRPHARPDSRPSLNGITTQQFKSLDAKLDTILKLLRSQE